MKEEISIKRIRYFSSKLNIFNPIKVELIINIALTSPSNISDKVRL